MDGVTTFTLDQVVTGSDDNWYQLKVASSLNDDPVSGGSGNWLKILDGIAVPDNSITTAKLTAAARAKTVGFADYATMIASGLDYTVLSEGDKIYYGDERWAAKVAASGASDHHLQITGGAKLYVVARPGRVYHPEQFGCPTDGVSSCSAAWNLMGSVLPNGATVRADADQTYYFDTRVDFPEINHLTVDFNHCTILLDETPSSFASASKVGLSVFNFGSTGYTLTYFKDNFASIPTTYDVVVKNLDHEGVFTGDPLTDDLLDAANYTYSAALLSFVKVSGFKVKKCNVKNQRSVLSYSWATLGKNKIFRCTVETCRQQPIAATANAYIGGTPYSDFMARDELEISYSTFDKLGPFVADYHQDNSSQRSGFRMHHCDVTNYAGIIYKSQSWAYSKESDYAIIEDCYFKPNNALDLSLVGFSFGLLVDDCGSADLIIRNNKFDSFKYGIGRARGPNIRRIQINNNVGTWTNAATVNPCFLVSDSGTDYVGAMELMQARVTISPSSL